MNAPFPNNRRLYQLMAILCGLVVVVSAALVPAVRAESLKIGHVGNVVVTHENKDDIFGDGTVRFDSDTDTLFLRNATINTHRDHINNQSSRSVGITFYEGDIKINLSGENVLQLTPTQDYASGLQKFGHSALTFSGDGTLTMRVLATQQANRGIDNLGGFIVDGPTLDIHAGDSTHAHSIAINTYFGDLIVTSGHLRATAGKAGGHGGSVGFNSIVGKLIAEGGKTELHAHPGAPGEFPTSFAVNDSDVDIRGTAELQASGGRRAFFREVWYPAQLPVWVNTKPDPHGAVTWDRKVPLGGDHSLLKYVAISPDTPDPHPSPNPPPDRSLFTIVRAILAAIGGMGILAGVIAALSRLIPLSRSTHYS
ncbi:hypothetical protein P4N68_04445 [Corynebacterium felinum]|uniref:Uncharacterized protein n=1 Tax=Corynebacterium felinum TaxID=131318 RepID=A0ABU2B515_9CORY|nr:hypothetical protein [Corynebacterium felinum]MDF5820335.1 hypothetical protein [Corynebacterium felinum]MDR7353702.1 hypothetical protein [Corynebacterium felinum]WJY95881.1 hypothetical protein CFELI_11455 [Corynebacterium felinum]